MTRKSPLRFPIHAYLDRADFYFIHIFVLFTGCQLNNVFNQALYELINNKLMITRLELTYYELIELPDILVLSLTFHKILSKMRIMHIKFAL